MNREIKIPEVGESITSGVLAGWLKQEGEMIAEGEEVLELETDKAVVKVPSPAAGKLKIEVEAGKEVSIGQTVGHLISQENEAESEPTAPPSESGVEKDRSGIKEKDEVKPAAAYREEQAAVSSPDFTIASEINQSLTNSDEPGVREIARLSERKPMTRIRKKTAEYLVRARQNAAYLTTFNEIDMQKVIEIRKHYQEHFQQEHGVKISFLSFFVKACCQALKEFPEVNAQIDGDDFIYHHFCDIGVAVSIEEGLLVPILRNADRLHFSQIEKALVSLAQRARQRTILPEDLSGGTFTITNGGVFGSLLSTPIPMYPQTAILGMHAIKKRPVVQDEQIVIRPMMYAALSYDHRVIDGREAIGFLNRVKELIEEPDKLLMEL